MKITAQQLRELGACEDQVGRFVDLFGEEVEVTRELCIRHAQDFNFDWASKRLLTEAARRAYANGTATAWAVYVKAVEPAHAAYEAATTAAWDACTADVNNTAAYDAYDAVADAACDACQEATTSARRVCDEAKAATWADAALSEENEQ